MTAGPDGAPASRIRELEDEIAALRREVRDLRAANAALLGGEVDAVVGGEGAKLLQGAQEALGRLAAIVESSADAIYSQDLDGTILTWNLGAERLLGYAAAEIVGRNVTALVPPEGRAALRESLERARAGEGSAPVETERIRKDGTRIRVARTLWPIRGPGGGVTGAAVSLRDISERLRAEEAARAATRLLRESEKKYRNLVETSQDLIWSVDPSGRITFINSASVEFYGYEPAELIGRSFFEFVPEQQLAADRAALAGELESGIGKVDYESQMRHRDGHIVHMLANAVVERDDEGRVVSISGTSKNITAWKRANEELRAATNHLRALITSAPVAIVALGPDLRVSEWNPAAERIFGWTAGEVVGGVPPAVPPELVHEARALAARVLSGERVQLETEGLRKDGTRIPVRLSVGPTRDASDRVDGILAVFEDVSTTRALQEQLLQAQKLEAVGRLAGGVAHDFNNHLTAILGYAELLLSSSKLESGERENLQEVQRAAERAAALTRQLLAFSRRQVLLPEVLDLASVVRGLTRMLERLIGEDIRVNFVAAPDLWMVEADPGQMEQVVMNLAVNARDAMPSGGTLAIELRNVELDEEAAQKAGAPGAGAWVLLSVADTGIGMPPDVRARIFEPFFTTKEKGKGTGLGLSTVLGIVAQSGGSISVSSEPGRGTTFRVYLSRSLKTRRPRGVSSAELPAVRVTGTILLVEDQEQVRRLARMLLEKAGFTVLEAADAEAALEISRSHKGAIDLLLSDVVMPGPGGRELASILRGERPGLRVLLMSGYTEDAIGDIAALEPGTAFIQKPFPPQALSTKVREVLGARS